MPGHAELVIAQQAHHLDLVAGERPHAVRHMIRRARGLTAIPEASKVGDDHGEVLG
jgi:hypothetical protein